MVRKRTDDGPEFTTTLRDVLAAWGLCAALLLGGMLLLAVLSAGAPEPPRGSAVASGGEAVGAVAAATAGHGRSIVMPPAGLQAGERGRPVRFER